MRTWEEVGRRTDTQEGDGKTELMVEMMEGGVREETGGARVDQVETGGASEQAEPGGTQATAVKMTHGRAGKREEPWERKG